MNVSARFGLALLAGLSLSSVTLASTAPIDLMVTRQASDKGYLPGHAKPSAGLSGRLNDKLFSAAALKLTLPDGRVLVARQEHETRNAAKGRQTWTGDFEGRQGSQASFTRVGSTIVGTIVYEGRTYEVMPASGGTHALYEVEEARLPLIEKIRVPASFRGKSGQAADAVLAPPSTQADPFVHDALIVYTAASAARYGAPTIQAMIANGVAMANTAYRSTGVGITLNLAHTQQVAVTEGATMEDTLTTLEASAEVNSLRNTYGADVVIMVAEHSDYCGLANLMSTESAAFAPYAKGVVASVCISNHTIAHEIGHIQGLLHDRENSIGFNGARPYGFGYRICAADGFRDIMSYACTNGTSPPRIGAFSTPNYTYNGYPMGIAHTPSTTTTSADGTLALNDTADTVAGFRVSVSTAPATPTGLVSSGVTTTQATFNWTDVATNETGYYVYRSFDNVNFSLRATLGANATTYTDIALSPGTVYYYRVVAFNSLGSSTPSNTVAITTLPAEDTTPNAFSFATQTNVAVSTLVTSAVATITGITANAAISVENGEFSVGCTGTFGTAASTIGNNQAVCVRHTSASTYLTDQITRLTVGGVVGTFTSRTVAEAVDITPNPFSFVSQTNVALSASIISAPVTIAGITGAAPVSVTNGEYSVGCSSPYTAAAGTILNGQPLCLRHTSSGINATTVTTVVTVGGVSSSFSSTTLAAADTTPNSFSFPAQSNVELSAVIVSAPVTITGINAPAPISVIGGEYSIGCTSSFTTAGGTIQNNQQVCVRHTSSSVGVSTVTTSLNVGGVSAVFSSTTRSTGSSGGGGGSKGGGGSFDLLGLLGLGLVMAAQRRRRK
jgi:peptidyl-Asp metalloendopeptidase